MKSQDLLKSEEPNLLGTAAFQISYTGFSPEAAAAFQHAADPERQLHLRGSNAVFRMDRSADTAINAQTREIEQLREMNRSLGNRLVAIEAMLQER